MVRDAMQMDSQRQQRAVRKFQVVMSVQDAHRSELGNAVVEGEVPENEEPVVQIVVRQLDDTVPQELGAGLNTPDTVMVDQADTEA